MHPPALFNGSSPKNLTGHAGLGQLQSLWHGLGLAKSIDENSGKKRGYLLSLLVFVGVAKHATGCQSNAAISDESETDSLMQAITGFVVKQFTLNRAYGYLGESEIAAINRRRVKALMKRGRIDGDYIAIDSTHEEIKRTRGFKGWSVGHTGEGDEKPGYRSVFTFDVVKDEWITFSHRTASFFEGHDLLPLVRETKGLLGKTFTLIMDAGFHSIDRFEELLDEGIHFVINLREDIRVREPHREFQTVRQELEGLSPARLFKYGDEGYYWSKIVYLANSPRKFRLVVVHKQTKGEDKLKDYALLTSDLSLSPRMVIELYTRRWRIEKFFDYLKNDLGLEAFCRRDFNGIRAHVFVCALAYSLLMMVRGPESRSKPSTIIRKNVNRPASFWVVGAALVLWTTSAIVKVDWGGG